MIKTSDLALMTVQTDEDFFNFLKDSTITECIDKRSVIKSTTATIHTKRLTHFGYYALFTNYNSSGRNVAKNTLIGLYDVRPDKQIQYIDIAYSNLFPKSFKSSKLHIMRKDFFTHCMIACLSFLKQSAIFQKEYMAIEYNANRKASDATFFMEALIRYYRLYEIEIDANKSEFLLESIHKQVLFKEDYDYASITQAIIQLIDNYQDIEDKEWLIAKYLTAFNQDISLLDDEKRHLFEMIQFISDKRAFELTTKTGKTKAISKSSLKNILNEGLTIELNQYYLYEVPVSEITVIKTKKQTYYRK